MFWLKPTKRKILISLIPAYFLIPVILIIISETISLDISFINNALAGGGIISYLVFIALGGPFESILRNLNLWHDHSSLFIALSGSDIDFIGLCLIALFYSVIIYLFLSILQKYRSKK